MPEARKRKDTSGLRSDGTPRRPSHREQPPAARKTSTEKAAGASGERAKTGRSSATLGGSGGAKRTSSDRPVKAATVRRALPTGEVPIRKPRSGPARPKQPAETGDVERLQKVLANAGIGSRRASEELIAAGRVRVDGRTAELGDKVDPVNAEIYVDGERVITDARRVYLAINKPGGVVSTMSDEKGREALADYLGNVPQRVYHVGRLDAESEGLLLLTNDGTLAHRLMHPSYGVPKTYLAEVAGPIRGGLRQQLLDGVELEDGPVRVDAFRVVDSLGKRVLVEVVLHEGRKHIVRRMLAEVGHPVSRLVRTAIGPIKIGDLKAGRTRRLTRGEIAALFKAVED
jgi:23S rRNA pseudouridine2605 synthase